MAAIGELSAGLAHEIGNPLAAISGSVQLLATSDPRATDSSAQAARDHPQREPSDSTGRSRAFSSSLDPSRRRVRQRVRHRRGPARERRAAPQQRRGDRRASHRAWCSILSTAHLVVADRDQIGQIFWNLTRNALRAMPEGGRLLISGDLTDLAIASSSATTARGMNEAERAQGVCSSPSRPPSTRASGLGMGHRLPDRRGAPRATLGRERTQPGHYRHGRVAPGGVRKDSRAVGAWT